MAWRFYKRVALPGIGSLNFSRSGMSLSVGCRGAHVTIGHRGIRRTFGIPGSGCYWTHLDGWHASGVHNGLGPHGRPIRRHHVVALVLLVVAALWIAFGR